jgi:beta-lactam-binding protein with PASTA domain
MLTTVGERKAFIAMSAIRKGLGDVVRCRRVSLWCNGPVVGSRAALVEVPDVVGFAAVDASEIILRAGLSPVGPQAQPAPAVGTVRAQRPSGGARVTCGATVELDTGLGGGSPAGESVPPTMDAARVPA